MYIGGYDKLRVVSYQILLILVNIFIPLILQALEMVYQYSQTGGLMIDPYAGTQVSAHAALR